MFNHYGSSIYVLLGKRIVVGINFRGQLFSLQQDPLL